jgi:Predicted membrane protein
VIVFLQIEDYAFSASILCTSPVGEASKVVPIDKLSVAITLVLAFIFLHEQFTTKSVIGCILIGAGTILMVLKIRIFLTNRNRFWILSISANAQERSGKNRSIAGIRKKIQINPVLIILFANSRTEKVLPHCRRPLQAPRCSDLHGCYYSGNYISVNYR